MVKIAPLWKCAKMDFLDNIFISQHFLNIVVDFFDQCPRGHENVKKLTLTFVLGGWKNGLKTHDRNDWENCRADFDQNFPECALGCGNGYALLEDSRGSKMAKIAPLRKFQKRIFWINFFFSTFFKYCCGLFWTVSQGSRKSTNIDLDLRAGGGLKTHAHDVLVCTQTLLSALVANKRPH